MLHTPAANVRPLMVLIGRGREAKVNGAPIFLSDDILFARRDQKDPLSVCVGRQARVHLHGSRHKNAGRIKF